MTTNKMNNKIKNGIYYKKIYKNTKLRKWKIRKKSTLA